MDSAPLFSVVIPAYKVENFIRQTLRSVYRQSVGDFEIIVVNDGSPDGTLAVLQQESDPRLRIIDQANGGECVARNSGVRAARGQYVAFLDSDDAWLPDHLERAKRFFELHPEYDWYSTRYTRCSEITDESLRPSEGEDDGYEARNWFLEGDSITSSSSAVLRRSAIGDQDLFPPGVRMFGDNIGWCRFALQHPMIGSCDRSTALYRIWGGSATDAYNTAVKQAASGLAADAIREHSKLAALPNCPDEAKLFFRCFVLSNYWQRISAASLISWLPELKERRPQSGLFVFMWMAAFCQLNHFVCRAMRWGVRRKLNKLHQQQKKLAAASHRQLP